MGNTNSTEIIAMISSSARAAANQLGGRVRVATFTVPAIPTGAGDTMTLTKLPKGAKVLRGVMQFSVAQGATATTAIGIAGTTGKYRVAAISNATTEFVFAEIAAVNMLNDTTAEETVIATNAAAVWTAAAFRGYLLYVVD